MRVSTVRLDLAPIGQAASQIATNRLLAGDVIVMHPRRWFWLATSLDLQNRPLVVPDGAGGSNTLAQMTSTAGSGVVGRILGLDVVADPNLPTNLGAGTNQDPILVLRTDDSILYESAPRLEVFRETKADQLSVFLRLYNYVAFTGARYPKSIAVINATGTIAPAGFQEGVRTWRANSGRVTRWRRPRRRASTSSRARRSGPPPCACGTGRSRAAARGAGC